MSEAVDVRGHLAIIDVALTHKAAGGGLDKFQAIATNEVVEIWRTLAEQDDGPALTLLGYCYWTGVGISRDIEPAAKCFHRAAKKGISQAQYLLGQCFKAAGDSHSNQQNAFIWHAEAAKQGDDNAITEVARHFFFGLGVTKDVSRARAMAEKAARAGNLDATVLYGTICLNSDDPLDEKRAATIFCAAAQSGSSDAQYLLAGCYEQGIGLDKDVNEAKRLYSQAAASGHLQAARAHAVLLAADHFSDDQSMRGQRFDYVPDSTRSADSEPSKSWEGALNIVSGLVWFIGLIVGWLSKVIGETGKGLLVGAIVGGFGGVILTGNPGGAIGGAAIGALLCGLGGFVFAFFGAE